MKTLFLTGKKIRMKFLLFIFLLVSKPTTDTVTHLGVYNEILEQGLEFPDIVFAQAVLESANFNSRLTKENNNLFGMKRPTKRSTTSIGILNGYASYDSWRESIEDYRLFQELLFSKHKFTRKSYLEYIDNHYSKTKGYKNRILQIIKKYKFLLYPPPSDRNDGKLDNNLVIP